MTKCTYIGGATGYAGYVSLQCSPDLLAGREGVTAPSPRTSPHSQSGPRASPLRIPTFIPQHRICIHIKCIRPNWRYFHTATQRQEKKDVFPFTLQATWQLVADLMKVTCQTLCNCAALVWNRTYSKQYTDVYPLFNFTFSNNNLLLQTGFRISHWSNTYRHHPPKS